VPFTVAHAAVALPARGGRLVPSAIVAGALAPDVWYYLPRAWAPVFPPALAPHSWAGALTVDLAVALVLTTAWRVALRRPWLTLLPQPWRAAALTATATPVLRPGRAAADLARVVASALIGVLSHLALDLVTHETGITGPLAEALATPVVGAVALRDVLQVLLSAVGLGLLAWAGWSWARRTRAGAPVTWSPVAVGVLALAGLAGVVGALRRADLIGFPPAVPSSVADAISLLLGGTGGAVAVLLGYALAWWAVGLTRGRRPRRPDAPATSPAARPRSRTPG
jgi:hypothetical protein